MWIILKQIPAGSIKRVRWEAQKVQNQQITTQKAIVEG